MSVSFEVPVGSVCEVKSLYSHSTSSRIIFCDPWSEIQDPVLEARRRKQVGQSYAIVHRFSKDGDAWATHSVEVKSPLLRTILDKIFHDYPGWARDDSPYTFFPPFKPLVHRWAAISDAYRAERASRIKLEMNLFMKEVEPLISTYRSDLEEATSSGVISFPLLWLLLDPGKLFVSKMMGNICVAKLVSAKYVEEGSEELEDEPDNKKDFWRLTLAQVDWNGSYCGLSAEAVDVVEYDEPTLITKLATVPLDLHPHQHDIRARLIARGRRFESLRGSYVMESTGKKFVEQRNLFSGAVCEVPEPVDGRIVVDAYAFYRCQHRTRPQLSRDRGEAATSEKGETNDERKEELVPLTDLECMLTIPLLRGFDLKAKKWCRFNLDEVREPSWNDSPYDNLAISDGDKQLLMAFAYHHRVRDTYFDDFVKDKGKGIIILLSGPPGVGKTLSAEAVAEKSRVALYVLGAGELGSDPVSLEAALTVALTCCQLWGATLLLDEADVFLETRGPNSLERNELVARPVLPDDEPSFIDPAFKSRVDLTLTYSHLDQKTRRQVWVNFIKRLPQDHIGLQEADIDKLSSYEINGREIKSAIKTALILAARDKPLKLSHLEIVLDNRRRAKNPVLHYTLPTGQEVALAGQQEDLSLQGTRKRVRVEA